MSAFPARSRNSAQERLDGVDWAFEATRSSALHNIHPWPAKFIPQIPRTLIDLFHPGDGQAVLDPFSGSGTTLVEAIAMGLPAVGIDLHPLAALISKVKTTPLLGQIEEAAREAAIRAHAEAAETPPIPRLTHWFDPKVADALARILAQVARIEEDDVRDALRICVSRLVVRVSNQESDTRYAAVEKNVSAEMVYDLFVKGAALLEAAMGQAYGKPGAAFPVVQVLNRDVLDVAPQEILPPIGMVVTSPPYPNAFEYWLYHKYRMYWLGMDPIAVRDREIGSRPHYFRKQHQTEDDFERQMSLVFALLGAVMRSGSPAAFLVGRSIIHGREIDNEALLRRAASESGFVAIASVNRPIHVQRRAFAFGRARTESITVFEAP